MRFVDEEIMNSRLLGTPLEKVRFDYDKSEIDDGRYRLKNSIVITLLSLNGPLICQQWAKNLTKSTLLV